MVNIGEILIERGKLTLSQVNTITEYQNSSNLRFGEAAVKLGLLNENDIISALNTQFEHPVVEIGKSKIDAAISVAYQCSGADVEALRTLRSQLMLRWFEKDKKTLLIVGDSCSSANVSAGVSILFSQMGQKTLLIDADLRNGTLHKVFGIGSSMGVSDFIAGRTNYESVLFSVEGLKSLDLIPAGTQANNHQELLIRETLRQFIKSMEGIYDVIIINGHQLNLASDSQMLASWIEGVLIVIKSGESTFSQVGKIRTDLELSGATVIGSVLI